MLKREAERDRKKNKKIKKAIAKSDLRGGVPYSLRQRPSLSVKLKEHCVNGSFVGIPNKFLLTIPNPTKGKMFDMKFWISSLQPSVLGVFC